MSKMMHRAVGLMIVLSLCVVVRASAELKDDQYERFYARYVGKYKVNVAKSVYFVGEPPKEAPSHSYNAIPGRKGIRYNDDVVHMLDGREYPLSTRQPGSTVARTVLDEFTVTNTIRRDGKVTAQNTLVLSPDGTEAVIVFMSFNEHGVAKVGSIVYYEKRP